MGCYLSYPIRDGNGPMAYVTVDFAVPVLNRVQEQHRRSQVSLEDEDRER